MIDTLLASSIGALAEPAAASGSHSVRSDRGARPPLPPLPRPANRQSSEATADVRRRTGTRRGVTAVLLGCWRCCRCWLGVGPSSLGRARRSSRCHGAPDSFTQQGNLRPSPSALSFRSRSARVGLKREGKSEGCLGAARRVGGGHVRRMLNEGATQTA